MEYGEKLMEHFLHPRNVGAMDEQDARVGTGVAGSPVCGDVLKLQIMVDDGGKIVDAKFKTFGCGASVASSSLATELLKGLTIEEAEKLKNADIAKELSLPPVKVHCSVLTEEAVRAAIADWRKKRPARENGAPAEEPAKAEKR